MSVSQATIQMIHSQVKASKRGTTFEDLVKVTKLSMPTIRNAIAYLRLQGSVVQSQNKPTIIRAIDIAPTSGQTLTINVPTPPVEIDPKIVANIQQAIAGPAKVEKDELFTVLFDRARTTPDKAHKLMVFMVNYTEALRLQIADSKELSIDDLDGK